MILTKKLVINIGSNTKKYYESKGYTIPKMISKTDWKLKVLLSDLPQTSSVKVECACEECGEVRHVRYRDLHRSRKSKLGADGKTYCGNCAKRFYHAETHPWYKHGNPLYTQYKQNAVKRNLNFNITVEQFVDINHKPCHYCGGMNEFVRNTHSGNGVDRVDNSRGYEIDNCVPCCTICNRAKNAMKYDDFKKWIERLVETNAK